MAENDSIVYLGDALITIDHYLEMGPSQMEVDVLIRRLRYHVRTKFHNKENVMPVLELPASPQPANPDATDETAPESSTITPAQDTDIEIKSPTRNILSELNVAGSGGFFPPTPPRGVIDADIRDTINATFGSDVIPRSSYLTPGREDKNSCWKEVVEVAERARSDYNKIARKHNQREFAPFDNADGSPHTEELDTTEYI